MTVEEMLNRMSSREMSEWMAYFQYEPFGTDVDDLRSGIIAATIVNCNTGKSSKTYEPKDFIPSRRKPVINSLAASLDSMLGKNFGTGEKPATTKSRTM